MAWVRARQHKLIHNEVNKSSSNAWDFSVVSGKAAGLVEMVAAKPFLCGILESKLSNVIPLLKIGLPPWPL